jgi:hypothetical protein
MLKALERFFTQPITDTRITFPTIEVVFNHRLKIAWVYCYDSDMRDDAYLNLESHLKRQGYFLQIEVAPRGLPGQQGADNA